MQMTIELPERVMAMLETYLRARQPYMIGSQRAMAQTVLEAIEGATPVAEERWR